ncbi:glycosyltransferase [Natronohydrobacter thiooxidans]|uniref:glycosyltransferase n=1 Tax=Natronohydrobacter thiooxidans TaxID=87172 RepID=UPI0008FF5D82|nr:glycosyltransferase [Natronohydrobacter thiooxidans]
MRGALLPELEAQIWAGPLADPRAPGRRLRAAFEEGASYRAVELALRLLWRLELPAAEVAARARAKWPNSIDFAMLALDLMPEGARDAGLAHLEACVQRGNRRRAVLANALLRAGRFGRARAALAQSDPTSETWAADLARRAELALACGDFARASADIEQLSGTERQAGAQALGLRLLHRRDGARALAAAFDVAGELGEPACAECFEIFLAEGDFTRAPRALDLWRAVPERGEVALARAESRLALERGESAAALALLAARLDPQAPWGWHPVDHIQSLRARMAAQDDPEAIRAHALAAQRLHPRHDWLAHVARMAREAVEDWRALEDHAMPAALEPERAMSAARAALRMGLSGRALVLMAQARRRAGPGEAPRLQALRAEAFWSAGRVDAARRAQALARAQAPGRPRALEAALLGAEIDLMQGLPSPAAAALAPLADDFPQRMALWLTQARIAFQQGDFAGAEQAHAVFNQLKATQIGAFEPGDVRDRITQDARAAAAGVEQAFAPGLSVQESIARAGIGRIAASPGLAACLMQRALAEGALGFEPEPEASIPRRIAHYWQGAASPAIARAEARWRKLHRGFEITLFDQDRAADWMRRHAEPDLCALFDTLSQPALRADIFRLCWICHEGGIFADLDEYPRLPVTDWLSGARAVFCVERGFGTIANNFLAAEPGHPVCLLARDMVRQALGAARAPYAWWHSGPAQWTRAAFAVHFGAGARGVRYLSQLEYNRRMATNLPYPHKRSPDHWR